MSKEAGWWHEFFKSFQPVFGVISPKVTNQQVHYFIKKLALKPGSRFLDCPCGVGRTALPMARQGIRVTSVDITQSYLEEFKTKAKRRKLKVDIVHADMRRIDFDSQFDAAGNIWTSFGFFDKESDDLLTLKKMYRALKPGGRFVLHVINRDWIVRNFQPNGWMLAGGIKILEDRKFDFASSKSLTTWTFIRDGEESVFETSIRMYSYHELIAMFKKVGFVDIEGFGSMKDEPITSESRMMFVFGKKPL